MFNFDFLDLNKARRKIQTTFIFLTLCVLYLPLFCFVLLSFNETSSKDSLAIKLGNWKGIENYYKFFSEINDNGVLEAFMNSFTISFIVTPISVFLGVFIAISLWKNYGRGKNFVFLCCNLSISSPDIVQAIAFSILFTVLLLPLGIDFGFFTIIVSHIAFSIPYVVMFIYPRLSKLSLNLLLATQDLKCTFFESLTQVIFPIIFPNILASSLLVFVTSFDDFIITNLVRGSVSTITTRIYEMKYGIKSWATVFGSLVIVVTFISVFFTHFLKSFKSKRNV